MFSRPTADVMKPLSRTNCLLPEWGEKRLWRGGDGLSYSVTDTLQYRTPYTLRRPTRSLPFLRRLHELIGQNVVHVARGFLHGTGAQVDGRHSF